MKYGIVQFTSDRGLPPAVAAKAAEGAGFHSFWVPEHTHIPVKREAAHPGTGTEELPDDRYLRTLDPWVALSMVAAVTSRIRLATAVALPVEHDPITLAKTIATLDHLSGGRVTLGAGYGWNIDELTHHGVPKAKRRTVLREYLEAMQQLWSQEEAEYHGDHVDFGPSWAWPKPVQQPRPPVLVGAGGTEKTFTWIARSADGWITTPTEGEIDDKVALLKRIWKEAGREGDPQVVALAGKPDPDTLARWEDLGVTEALFGFPEKGEEWVQEYFHRLAGKLGVG
ncbi:LLM class F420-dependent oxidoreductase [Saccharopolyspora rhizosphaerae]|uniref:LLM class F420-dependent oxidoreductase n=1 Tax=Saccharopolyspora rhizosphaerae TaxID=2492662 RepID=A0A426JWG5_9PSEU|nr:LLM class F420-dependent oxidoreductase [Saccharopolyspora rhizosphaerae]RRO17525.1 LLM class F420-dependent oxidoreductase [Saccharopolyspora rhizosphaerae]